MEGFGVIVLSRVGVLDEFPGVLDGTLLLRMKIKVGDAQGDGAGSVDGPNIQFPGGGGDAGLEYPDSGGRWNGCCLGEKHKTDKVATHGFSTRETPSLGSRVLVATIKNPGSPIQSYPPEKKVRVAYNRKH